MAIRDQRLLDKIEALILQNKRSLVNSENLIEQLMDTVSVDLKVL